MTTWTRWPRFADACDAVTFEFENLPAHAIAHLGEHVPVRPGAHALAVTQDRLDGKDLCRKAGAEDRAVL